VTNTAYYSNLFQQGSVEVTLNHSVFFNIARIGFDAKCICLTVRTERGY
jgi:hypothetical protein